MSDLDLETAFELEAELRSIERELNQQRVEMRDEMTGAFRRLNGEALHDADQREYPFTTPEKRAVRRETVGPVELLPEWEETYRTLVDDQQTARERLAEFHRDAFTDLAADEPYTLSLTEMGSSLDGPYLEVRARDDDLSVVLAVDNPLTGGYTYRPSGEYTADDVENALSLCADIEEVDADRLGLVTYNTDLVDFTRIRNEVDDPQLLRRRVQAEIVDTLDELAFEAIHTEESPLLTFIEAIRGAERGQA